MPDTVQKILSEKELIEKSFFVDMCFDEIDKVYIAYARFPFIWGNYSKNAHIDNVSIGADKNEEIAYQKALSEAIERVSASYQICEERRFDHLTLDNQKLLHRYYTYKSEDKIL